MQVTNGDIWQARGALQTLLSEKWPVKTAYWLAKLARKLNDQYGVVDEVRVKLVRQYGTESNGQFSIAPDSPQWEQFATEMNELMLVEVEIPIEKIVLPTSDKPDAPQVQPATLMALDPFVEVA